MKRLNDELITHAEVSIEQLSHEIVYLLIIYIRKKYGIKIQPL